MQILYPYNEVLPRKKAHDVFIFHECAALSGLGIDTTLLCGKGPNQHSLFDHYTVSQNQHFLVEPQFLIRKNNPFNISWNLPFFYRCQRLIEQRKPNIVFLSVLKQAAYHLARKIKNVRYLYEVHELSTYPNGAQNKNFDLEKQCLKQADLITVTTHALKQILQDPPYSLQAPIHVIPLAVNVQALPAPPAKPLTLMYVGQLYQGQGIELLLKAFEHIDNIQLKIVGGTPSEITHLSKKSNSSSIEFLGFVPPSDLSSIAQKAHAFIAPFEAKGRMPYVAHTKLLEYAEWGRPIIAPNLPIVTDHFADKKGILLFEPAHLNSLVECIRAIGQDELRERLQHQINEYSGTFSWKARATRLYNIL